MKTQSFFLAIICFLAFSFTAQAQVDKSSTKTPKKIRTGKFKKPNRNAIYRDSLFLKNNPKVRTPQTQNASAMQRNLKKRPGTQVIYKDSLWLKNRGGRLQPQSTKGHAQQISGRTNGQDNSIIAAGNQTPLAKEKTNRKGRNGQRINQSAKSNQRSRGQNVQRKTRQRTAGKQIRKGKKKNNN